MSAPTLVRPNTSAGTLTPNATAAAIIHGLLACPAKPIRSPWGRFGVCWLRRSDPKRAGLRAWRGSLCWSTDHPKRPTTGRTTKGSQRARKRPGATRMGTAEFSSARRLHRQPVPGREQRHPVRLGRDVAGTVVSLSLDGARLNDSNWTDPTAQTRGVRDHPRGGPGLAGGLAWWYQTVGRQAKLC
jgi:hypothetical protein